MSESRMSHDVDQYSSRRRICSTASRVEPVTAVRACVAVCRRELYWIPTLAEATPTAVTAPAVTVIAVPTFLQACSFSLACWLSRWENDRAALLWREVERSVVCEACSAALPTCSVALAASCMGPTQPPTSAR